MHLTCILDRTFSEQEAKSQSIHIHMYIVFQNVKYSKSVHKMLNIFLRNNMLIIFVVVLTCCCRISFWKMKLYFLQWDLLFSAVSQLTP